MNCVEFERVLPEFLEGSHTPEQRAHADSCPFCAGLVTDLNFISGEAGTLAGLEDPSPRVWHMLEAQLRSEGLIREPQVEPERASIFTRWRTAWLVPVAAALALAAGINLYHPFGAGDNVPVVNAPAVTTPNAVAMVSKEDQQMMNTVVARVPTQQARYRADLDDANAFIRDAEQSLKDDPNDVYTQQMLINAYAQKQMLYDLAVDRDEQ